MKLHYLWQSVAACGKRGTQGNQHLTTITDNVTCQKCLSTLRYFCGVTGMTYEQAHRYIGERGTKVALRAWRQLEARKKDAEKRPGMARLMSLGSGRYQEVLIQDGKRFNTLAVQDVKPAVSDVTFDGECDSYPRFMKGMLP